MTSSPDDGTRTLLRGADQRLVRAVDALDDRDWAAPSLLPGWSRAHVVAHLALNGEGLTAAVRGVLTGARRPVYASPEARDADIEDLAGQGAAALRSRLLAAVTRLDDVLDAVPDAARDTLLERTPDGPTYRVRAVPGMRLREVEIHHCDLDVGYTRDSWPTAFAERLVTSMTRREQETGFTAYAVDLDRSWTIGDGGPTVSGTAADLGWWLTGRGAGEGLTTDGGALPRTGAW